MLVEAIYDNGRLLFSKQYGFAHERFSIMVDVPDAEIVAREPITPSQENVAPSSASVAAVGDATGEYPAEYFEFKRLRDAIFGEDYVYVQEKTDRELMQEHWLEKHA